MSGAIGRSSLILIAALGVTAAQAAVTVTFDQVGADVQANVSGTLDLGGLADFTSGILGDGVQPSDAIFTTGHEGDTVVRYVGFTGPVSFGHVYQFGAGYYGVPSIVTGDDFVMDGGAFSSSGFPAPSGLLALSPTFASGDRLTAFNLYSNTTLAIIGFDPGTYVYTLPEDTITFNIGLHPSSGVPEPATWALMVSAFGAIGSGLRQRRRERASV